MAPIPLSLALLDEAAAPRAGIVPPCNEAEGTFADLPGFVNAFVTDDGGTGESTGGLGRTRAAARAAAIGEALERYAASHARLPLVAGRALPAARRLDLHELTLHSEAQRARADYPFVRAGSDETLFASQWDALPLPKPARAPAAAPAAPAPEISDFPSLLRALADAGIRTYYRDLTTPDVAALGLTVARVLAPALTPLAADHRWPCLGGRALDHRWRWPDRAPVGAIPNPLPHALG